MKSPPPRSLEEPSRTLADQAPLRLWAVRLDKGCAYINPCWLTLIGRRLEQELGDGWAAFQGYLALRFDVSERAQAERAFQRSQMLRYAAFEALPGSVVVVARGGHILVANPGWVQFARAHAADLETIGIGAHYRDACRWALQKGDGLLPLALRVDLDIDYANFDFPAEPFLDRAQSFALQGLVTATVQKRLLAFGIASLHLPA